MLVDGWRRIAAAIDLGNLLGLLAHNPVARTTNEVLSRIVETVDAE